VNGKYIRGYCLPDYAQKATKAPQTAQTVKVGVDIPLLRFGATGGAVRALQAILTAKGCDTQGIDGDFGANTEKAVKAFQRAKKLEDDGVVGKDTWTALLN
jgi:peptidoglycan hydrolase-like protein with peptidoglycan-binding domain